MQRDPGAVAAALTGTAEQLGDVSYGDAVQRLLAVVRTQLGMKVAWVSQFVGNEQVLRFVDAEAGADAPAAGTRLPLGGSFCARVLDGRFPAAIPDARGVPEAALLDVTADLHIGSYVGVPLMSPHGVAEGMLCAIHDGASPGLSDREVASMRLLAELLRDFQRRAQSDLDAGRVEEQLRFVLHTVISGKGRHPVLQPIVDLGTRTTIAAEGLTRFTLPSPAGIGVGARSTAQWFDDAGRLGMRAELEVATASSVLGLLDDVPAGVSLTVNLCPDTLLGSGLDAVLDGHDPARVIVEITEHARVLDYAELSAALSPYRERGLRVAVDDAGAGYASLTHVLALRPDLVKVDMALVRGADEDLARRALLNGLARFADGVGCRLVAEGVETPGELQAVADCGIRLVQGFLLGRPSPEPRWGIRPL